MIIFATIASLIHIYIFCLESLFWSKPQVRKIFKLSLEQSNQCQGFAFNQGFYNLFLALQILAGVLFTTFQQNTIGTTLIVFSCLSMLGAALVLVASSRKLYRPALIQGLPPFLALLFWVF